MEGKFLGFRVGRLNYSFDIEKVREIIRYKDIKSEKLQNTRGFIDGIFNLRGEIIPIVDMNKRICEDCDYEPSMLKKKRVVIVEINRKKVGILIDELIGIIDSKNEKLTTEIRNNLKDKDYILGFIKKDSRTFFIIKLPELLMLQ